MAIDTPPPIRGVPTAESRMEQTTTADGVTVWTIRQGRPHRMSVVERNEPTAQDVARFQRLAEQWREETFLSSSITANLAHPAYLTVMAMGEKALPLILRELESRGGQWTTALRYIVNQDDYPDKPADIGKPRELKEAWLTWGRRNRLL